MIDKFKKNHWYRFNGESTSVYIDGLGSIDVRENEYFMLDGKWHQCKEEDKDVHYMAFFYDSSDPNEYCGFGDMTKPKEERLHMFDEMSPAMYNIKKLKELRENYLDKTS